MRNFYYNASHCADPTAYEALVNVTREERRVNKKPRKKPDRRKYRHVEHHKE